MSSSKLPQRSGHVPILPASSEGQPAGAEGSAAGRLTSAAISRKRPKRTQITPVACQPCQQRKSKCDGARPACSSCSARNRTDCWYNAAGDQRRTASLKQRIRELEQETDELREALAIANARNAQPGEPSAGAELRTRQWQRAQNAQRAANSPLSVQESVDRESTDFESQPDLTSDMDALETSHDTHSMAAVSASMHHLTSVDHGPQYVTSGGGLTADVFTAGFSLAEAQNFGGTPVSGAAMMQNWPWTAGADVQWNYDPNATHGGGMS